MLKKERARCDTDEPATKSLTLRVSVYVHVCVCVRKNTVGGGKSVADLLHGESEWTNAQVGLCVCLCVKINAKAFD